MRYAPATEEVCARREPVEIVGVSLYRVVFEDVLEVLEPFVGLGNFLGHREGGLVSAVRRGVTRGRKQDVSAVESGALGRAAAVSASRRRRPFATWSETGSPAPYPSP